MSAIHQALSLLRDEREVVATRLAAIDRLIDEVTTIAAADRDSTSAPAGCITDSAKTTTAAARKRGRRYTSEEKASAVRLAAGGGKRDNPIEKSPLAGKGAYVPSGIKTPIDEDKARRAAFA